MSQLPVGPGRPSNAHIRSTTLMQVFFPFLYVVLLLQLFWVGFPHFSFANSLYFSFYMNLHMVLCVKRTINVPYIYSVI